MKNPSACGHACQFIKPNYPAMERKVHGRERQVDKGDELFFGPYRSLHRAALRTPLDGAQWTGITTSLAQKLLEEDQVDAVITVAPDAADRWRPQAVIVTDASALAQCRGMRMGYAPILAMVEKAIERGYRRLAVIAVGCQVYALRALEKSLGLETLYVIGTPCSDNTTTKNFHLFLEKLDDEPERITYLEFRADFRVELRYDDGRRRLIPFLNLPISDLPDDFFPLTCRTCVDYSNVLADITVGYMGGQGDQWLIVRNDRGQQMLDRLGHAVRLKPVASKGDRTGAVKGFLQNTRRAAGGLPLRRMPGWLRPIVSWLMPRIGPKGLEFARSRLEMKAIETVLHLERHAPRKMKNMIPSHVWQMVARYALAPPNTAAQPRTAPQDRPET